MFYAEHVVCVGVASTACCYVVIFLLLAEGVCCFIKLRRCYGQS